MTLPDYLTHLEKLCEGATEGPWTKVTVGSKHETLGISTGRAWSRGGRVAVADLPEDQEFIAASRQALPRLIKIVRAAVEVVEAAKAYQAMVDQAQADNGKSWDNVTSLVFRNLAGKFDALVSKGE